MRVTPICPSWFVNMACPIIGVPFRTFFFATALGFIPVNVVLISTGLTLSEMTTVGFNPKVRKREREREDKIVVRMNSF